MRFSTYGILPLVSRQVPTGGVIAQRLTLANRPIVKLGPAATGGGKAAARDVTQAPTDPTNVAVIVNADNSVTVSWSPVAGAASYSVRYVGDRGRAYSIPQVQSPFQTPPLTAGSSYSISVIAQGNPTSINTRNRPPSSPGANAVIIDIPDTASHQAAMAANAVVAYDANGNPLNAAGSIVPGAPSQTVATNGTTTPPNVLPGSPVGGGSGGGGGGGPTTTSASGQVIDAVVVGYDNNGNPLNSAGQIVPGACGGIYASVVAGYDASGNPVDCNGLPLPGANPCSGVVAGYDSNGNPVDCNGLPVPGAAACGGVMAGTDVNGNPVDCNGLPVGAGASSQYTPGGALATAAAAQPAPGGAITTAAGLPGALGTPAQPVSGSGVWWLLGGVAVVGVGAYMLGKD